jgi:Zn-dependent protease/predicted transcriptional regulator
VKAAYRIARVSGIDIKIHLTFPLILFLIGAEWASRHGTAGFIFGVLLALALFTCVTLHELGHSLAAQAFKIPVREIVLLPIGGVAMFGKLPEKPGQELVIAAAGPAVNVVIAGLLMLFAGPVLTTLDGQGLVEGVIPPPSIETFIFWLLVANLTLVAFNLIPAFPLDGGRMLRALLAMFTNYARATKIAAVIGQVFAVLLGVWGLTNNNFILAIIAVFIFFGAGVESFQAKAKTVLHTLRVGDAYNKHAIELVPGDRVSRVVDYILTSYQPDFGVVLGGNLLGVVTRDDVLKTLASRTDDPYVAEIMRRDVVRVSAGESLEQVQERMGENNARVVAVYSGERYLGLVSSEDLKEALSVLFFVRRQREAALA